MNLSDFDYFLPPDLIAQEPAPFRDRSRLMVLERKSGKIFHDRFDRLPEHIWPGDAVVLNDTKVRPVRLQGKKESGGKIEVLLIRKRRGGNSSGADPFPSKNLFQLYDLLLAARERIDSQLNKQMMLEEILILWSEINRSESS